MRATVALVYVLDHLLASVVLDIQVDVRRFVALARDEALEQQIHTHRVDGGDAQAVADDRVGGRAAPLAEDAALTAEADELVHGQEIARVVEFVDERQLAFDLAADLVGEVAGSAVGADVVAVAAVRALPGQAREPLHRGGAVGQTPGRVAVAQLLQPELAHLGDLARARHRQRVVGVQGGEGSRRVQGVLGVAANVAARLADAYALADAGEQVLQRPPRRDVVEHLGGGHDGDLVALGSAPEQTLEAGILGAAVAARERVQVGTEGILETIGDLVERARFARGGELEQVDDGGVGDIGGGGVLACGGTGHRRERSLGRQRADRRILVDGLHEEASVSPPECEQSLGVFAHLQPGDAAHPLGATEPAPGDQAAEVGVAGAGAGQQHQDRAVLQAHLRADDQVHSEIACPQVRLDDAVHAVAVGQRDRAQAQMARLLDQFRRVGGALQEGEVALAPQGHVGERAAEIRGSGHGGPGLRDRRGAALSIADKCLLFEGFAHASPPFAGASPAPRSHAQRPCAAADAPRCARRGRDQVVAGPPSAAPSGMSDQIPRAQSASNAR